MTSLGVIGAGNGLILTAYLGATLSGVRPEQAGIASGTLNTIQQFAACAGLAAIGAVYFAVLGAHPARAQYARATEAVTWIGLGLIVIMAALATRLPGPAAPDALAQPEAGAAPEAADGGEAAPAPQAVPDKQAAQSAAQPAAGAVGR